MAKGDEAADDDRRYEAFLTLFSRDRDRLFAYVFSLIPRHAEAEDAFQRCSLLLWRKFDEFDSSRSFLPWACGVALNEVRNILRSQRSDRLRFDDDLLGRIADQRLARREDSDERLAALRGCLQSLKTPDRELMQAVYADETKLTELARDSGRALQTLYNRVGLLRRMLFECVQTKLAAAR